MDGYEFDRAGVEAAHREWKQLLEDLRKDAELASVLVDLTAPGNEPASDNMVAMGSRSGNEFIRHNTNMQEYVQAYVDNLAKARDDYLLRDAETRRTLHGKGEK
jgi:hypothetical protein